MISDIRIRNFKSIVNLDLSLGRFNVIIGPNGCGKSNILEAIAFGSSAIQGKLDYEYLINRDVRVSDPKFMFNAFEEDEVSESGGVIDIKVICDERTFLCQAIFDENSKKWVNINHLVNQSLLDIVKDTVSLAEDQRNVYDTFESILYKSGLKIEDYKSFLQSRIKPADELSRFLTYSPTEQYLRKTFESSIFPLGVHGEGLLKYLKEVASEKNISLFEEINEGLRLLEWFDGFLIPDDLLTNEYHLVIGDRYLKDSLHFFDEKSTNEGFLFLLFYLTLFNSKDTPQFFAIDNIETALNPKLMTKLTDYLIKRSFENNKQIILTTHSPFVLDALDLSNDDVRLFVARRNIDGHTKLERVPYRKERKMKLSQLWMSGLIGGLPDNF